MSFLTQTLWGLVCLVGMILAAIVAVIVSGKE